MPDKSCMPQPWCLALHSRTRVKILPQPIPSQTHNPKSKSSWKIRFCMLLSLTCMFYPKTKNKKTKAKTPLSPWVQANRPLAAGTHLSISLNDKMLLLAPTPRITLPASCLPAQSLHTADSGSSLERPGQYLHSSKWAVRHFVYNVIFPSGNNSESTSFSYWQSHYGAGTIMTPTKSQDLPKAAPTSSSNIFFHYSKVRAVTDTHWQSSPQRVWKNPGKILRSQHWHKEIFLHACRLDSRKNF